jgi:hypothetical protein
MDIKITKKPTGIPQAEIACSSGERTDGVRIIMLAIASIDAHQIREGVGRVTMSPTEARTLAAELLRTADEAEQPELTAQANGREAALAFLCDCNGVIETLRSIRTSVEARRRRTVSSGWSDQRAMSSVLEELSRLDGFLEIMNPEG